MAEKMDEILRAVADRANAGVDYAAMRSGTLKKAQAKELALRKNISRYGSVAAAAVLLASFGIGALSGGFFGMSAKSEAPDNAYFAVQDPAVPESEEQLFGSESATGGSAPTERANGGDDRGDAAAPSTPAATGAPAVEPPGCCGLDSASLYWAEGAASRGELRQEQRGRVRREALPLGRDRLHRGGFRRLRRAHHGNVSRRRSPG